MMDAFRYNYLSEKNTPFLHKFINENIYFKLKPYPGFNNFPSLFCGNKKENDVQPIGKYVFDPKNSLFKFLSHPIPQMLDKLPFQNKIRSSLTILYNNFQKLNNNNKRILINWTPWTYLSYFSIINSGDYIFNSPDSLFSKLKKINKMSNYIGSPYYNQDYQIYKKVINLKPSPDFLFIFLSQLDFLSHKFGPMSKQAIKYLRFYDNYCEKIVKNETNKSEDICFIFFSDHGMVPVNNWFNINEYLKNNKINLKKDKIIMFSDSTILRFWGSKRSLSKVNEIMESNNLFKNLQNYEQNIRNKFIAPNYRYNGDLIYSISPENVIYPDYWHDKTKILGMHGYLDIHEDQYGFFGINKEFMPDLNTINLEWEEINKLLAKVLEI